MKCLHCGRKTSNAKFCSYECSRPYTLIGSKTRKMRAVNSYESNPKKCKHCSSPIPYSKRRNDFCNHSCCASFSNIGNRKHGLPPRHCPVCNKPTRGQKYKTCSPECSKILKKNERDVFLKDWISKETNPQVKHDGISQVIRACLFEIHRNRCEQCGWGEFNQHTLKIPLQVHHEDGDSTNNRFANLKLLCPNCHALTKTYGSLNAGRGRKRRKEKRSSVR